MAKAKLTKLPPKNIYFWNPAGFVFRVMNPDLVPPTGVGNGKSKREKLERHLDIARRRQVYCFNRDGVPASLLTRINKMAPGPDKRRAIKDATDMYTGLFPCRELDPSDPRDRKLIDKHIAEFIAAQEASKRADERFRVKSAGSEEAAKEMLMLMLADHQKERSARAKPAPKPRGKAKSKVA